MVGPVKASTRWAVNQFFFNPHHAREKEALALDAYTNQTPVPEECPDYNIYTTSVKRVTKEALDAAANEEARAIRNRGDDTGLKDTFLDNIDNPILLSSNFSLGELYAIRHLLTQNTEENEQLESQKLVLANIIRDLKAKKTPDSLKLLEESKVHNYPRGEAYYLKAKKDQPTIIAFHGNDGLSRWQFLQLYEECQRRGYGLLCPEYRSFTEGFPEKPSETNVYLDGQAAIHYLKTHAKINPSEIIVYGESLGAAIATEVAHTNKNIKGLVLNCPFASARIASAWVVDHESKGKGISGLFKRGVGFGARTLINRHIAADTFDNEGKAATMRVPTWVISSTEDTRVPPEQHDIVNGNIDVPYWHAPKKVAGEHLSATPNDIFEVIAMAAGIGQDQEREENQVARDEVALPSVAVETPAISKEKPLRIENGTAPENWRGKLKSTGKKSWEEKVENPKESKNNELEI